MNMKLSEIFLQLHISEKSGRGVPKIIEVYGRKAFEFRQNSIVVTIPFNRLDLGIDLGSDTQVIPPVKTMVESDEISRRIIRFCAEPKSTKEITEYLGFKERKSTAKHLKNLLQSGRLAMTIPDKPNSSKQKYIAIK